MNLRDNSKKRFHLFVKAKSIITVISALKRVMCMMIAHAGMNFAFASANKRPMLVPKYTGKYYPTRKLPQLNSEVDVEEIKRLMKREIPPVPAGVVDGDHLCEVCYLKDHSVMECVCLEEIPKGVEVISPIYDIRLVLVVAELVWNTVQREHLLL